MRVIETSSTFPLSSVKPLEGLLRYRAYCLSATRNALKGAARRRERSAVSDRHLEPFGDVDGIAYLRCPETGSLFLADLPEPTVWARLLADVSRYRHSSEAFHTGLVQSRTDNVYAPKLEWIQDTLRLQGLEKPRILEAVTAPSHFTRLLQESGAFAEVLTEDEMDLRMGGRASQAEDPVHAAVLLESLDRVDDPAALLRAVTDRLAVGGVVFVTALVASGFDMAVLGLRNLYLYPPDRANCLTVRGLSMLLERSGLTLQEVSTPGVLDVEIVNAHLQRDPSLPLPAFERQLLGADRDTHEAFQAFLQQRGLSSFARIAARKR